MADRLLGAADYPFTVSRWSYRDRFAEAVTEHLRRWATEERSATAAQAEAFTRAVIADHVRPGVMVFALTAEHLDAYLEQHLPRA